MFTRFTCVVASCLLSLLLLVPTGGCKKEEAPETKAPTPTADAAKPAEVDAASEAEVKAKLAKADLLDGKADKIVTKCPGCAFKMDGSSEHALEVLDYTLYFCTAECAKNFGKNMTESILAMKIPEG